MSTQNPILAEHRDIRALIRSLHLQMEAPDPRRDPQAAVHDLLRLAGLLKQHFGQEKVSLYGRLVASSDPRVRATALCAQDDLCGLEPRVVDFIRHWTAAGRIEEDPQGYLREARGLFRAIGQRLGQEERELLPLLEAAG